jgi:hypothetical protein
MNWKLLFTLSLFGLAMAFATVSLIPATIEPFLWLIIFIACAWFIVKNTNGPYFMHGFVLSLINCIYIVVAHLLFYHTYIAHHSEMAQMNANMPLSNHPRLMMLILGPVFGVILGLVQGLIAFIVSKLVKK